jgi:hypothetical protein
MATKGKKLGTGTIELTSEKTERERAAKLKKNKSGSPFPQSRWWTLPVDQMGQAVKGVVDHIQKIQSGLELQRQICIRLYGGTTPGSGVATERLQVIHPSLLGRLTYNIIAIVIDALVSKITKTVVRPLFLTQGGNYRLQRRAKKLSQFADGIFYETKFDEMAPIIFRDGCISGDGITHVYKDPNTKRVAIERCLASEIFVDEVDGFYGAPTQMHRAKLMDRERLVESFGYTEAGKEIPEIIEMIKGAGSGTKLQGSASANFVADTVVVVESWRLPSSVEAGDGRHCITVDTGVLFEEKYEKLRFPFSRFSWKTRVHGWHGGGLAEELIGTQVEMNHLLLMMQRAFRMMAAFKIVVENGTVPDQHFNDRVGTILHIPKGAQMPQYLAPPALNAQYFQHFEQIKARGFEIARLSAMSATGEKPAGLDSGEAQRTYHDIEAEGFQNVGKVYERYHLDTISLVIDVVRDIFEEERSYKLTAPVGASSLPGRKFLRTIDWKQVKLDEDEYSLKCYPTSNLPNTPAGRLATVNDLTKAGFIDQETSRKLLDFPDLSQVETLLGAAEDWIMKVLDGIIEDGDFIPPDPFMNLAMAEKLALQEFALGAANDMEDEKLDMLRSWIQQVQYLKAKAAESMQPPLPAPGAPAGAPAGAMQPGMGVPEPPPTSSLLPPAGMVPAQA